MPVHFVRITYARPSPLGERGRHHWVGPMEPAIDGEAAAVVAAVRVLAGEHGGTGGTPGGGDRPELPLPLLQQQPLVSHQRVLRQVRSLVGCRPIDLADFSCLWGLDIKGVGFGRGGGLGGRGRVRGGQGRGRGNGGRVFCRRRTPQNQRAYIFRGLFLRFRVAGATSNIYSMAGAG